jgi:hypothetical protein
MVCNPSHKIKTGKFGLIVIECVKYLETTKCHGPTILELLKKVRGFFSKITVKDIVEETEKLMHAGLLSVEHGSNRWTVVKELSY